MSDRNAASDARREALAWCITRRGKSRRRIRVIKLVKLGVEEENVNVK